MNTLELLKGKKMKVITDMKVEVELTIKEVKVNSHSRDLELPTPANDWWPAQENWQTVTVYFTNGASKDFRSLSSIDVY